METPITDGVIQSRTLGMTKEASNAWERIVKKLVLKGKNREAMKIMKRMTRGLPDLAQRDYPMHVIPRPSIKSKYNKLLQRIYHQQDKVDPSVYAKALKGAQKEWLAVSKKPITRRDIKLNKMKLKELYRDKINYAKSIGPNKEVEIVHGGGKRFLERLMDKKNTGYNLESSGLRGIQVHPKGSLDSISKRVGFYASSKAPLYYDKPAMLTGKIKAKYLQSNPANPGYEAGISADNIRHLRLARIKELNIPDPTIYMSDTELRSQLAQLMKDGRL